MGEGRGGPDERDPVRHGAITWGLRCDAVQRIPACLLASAACFGTDAAVLHSHLRVTLALLGTHPAGFRARLEHASRGARLKRRLASQHASCSLAHVGTIKVQADTSDKVAQMFFLAQAGVSATRARLTAGGECLDDVG
jgi:hypothetical protein